MCEAAEVLRTSKDVDGRSCSEAPVSGGAGGRARWCVTRTTRACARARLPGAGPEGRASYSRATAARRRARARVRVAVRLRAQRRRPAPCAHARSDPRGSSASGLERASEHPRHRSPRRFRRSRWLAHRASRGRTTSRPPMSWRRHHGRPRWTPQPRKRGRDAASAPARCSDGVWDDDGASQIR